MRLLVCKLCEDGEPFACPFKFRRTYMFLHLEKSHGMSPAGLAFTKSEHATPDGRTIWMAERGAESKAVLDEVIVPVSGSSTAGDRAEPPRVARTASAPGVDRAQRSDPAGKAARAGYPDWTGASSTYGSMH